MDDKCIDDFARRFARLSSRRQMVQGLAVGVLAAAFGQQHQAAAEEDFICPSLDDFKSELRARTKKSRTLSGKKRRAALRELRKWIREVQENCDELIFPMRIPSPPKGG